MGGRTHNMRSRRKRGKGQRGNMTKHTRKRRTNQYTKVHKTHRKYGGAMQNLTFVASPILSELTFVASPMRENESEAKPVVPERRVVRESVVLQTQEDMEKTARDKEVDVKHLNPEEKVALISKNIATEALFEHAKKVDQHWKWRMKVVHRPTYAIDPHATLINLIVERFKEIVDDKTKRDDEAFQYIRDMVSGADVDPENTPVEVEEKLRAKLEEITTIPILPVGWSNFTKGPKLEELDKQRDEELTAELSALGLRALHQRAAVEGLDASVIAGALDSDSQKSAIVKAIVAVDSGGTHGWYVMGPLTRKLRKGILVLTTLSNEIFRVDVPDDVSLGERIYVNITPTKHGVQDKLNTMTIEDGTGTSLPEGWAPILKGSEIMYENRPDADASAITTQTTRPTESSVKGVDRNKLMRSTLLAELQKRADEDVAASSASASAVAEERRAIIATSNLYSKNTSGDSAASLIASKGKIKLVNNQHANMTTPYPVIEVTKKLTSRKKEVIKQELKGADYNLSNIFKGKAEVVRHGPGYLGIETLGGLIQISRGAIEQEMEKRNAATQARKAANEKYARILENSRGHPTARILKQRKAEVDALEALKIESANQRIDNRMMVKELLGKIRTALIRILGEKIDIDGLFMIYLEWKTADDDRLEEKKSRFNSYYHRTFVPVAMLED